MHVVVLAAAKRGCACLRDICGRLAPEDRITVFTFPETAWEPPFVDEIAEVAAAAGGETVVTRRVDSEEFASLWSAGPDLVLVIGWRYMISSAVYEGARLGCYILHDSYLPEYRGFGPTVWAIRNGESHTGASLFRAVGAMDAGPIVDKRKISIGENDYIGDVMIRVTEAYLDILDKNFASLINGTADLHSQVESDATYTCKTVPADFQVDWTRSAMDLRNLVRSYSTPYPGAFTYLEGRKITIYRAELDRDFAYVGSVPGRFLRVVPDRGISVATGEGQLLVTDVAIDGGEIVSACSLPFSVSSTFSNA